MALRNIQNEWPCILRYYKGKAYEMNEYLDIAVT